MLNILPQETNLDKTIWAWPEQFGIRLVEVGAGHVYIYTIPIFAQDNKTCMQQEGFLC